MNTSVNDRPYHSIGCCNAGDREVFGQFARHPHGNVEVPRQGTGRGRWHNRGVAPAYGEMPFQGICSFHSHTHGDAADYGEFAPSGRTAPDHAPAGRNISRAGHGRIIPHAPTGHFTVAQGTALGHGNAVGMVRVVPHAPTGHFTVAQGTALGTKTEREYALTGHFNVDVEVPLQGTKYVAWRYRGDAPAYGEFAPSGRTAPDHAPAGRNISRAGHGRIIPHAPTGHFTVAQGTALGMQTNQTCALTGHVNNVAWTFRPWPLPLVAPREGTRRWSTVLRNRSPHPSVFNQKGTAP